MKIVLTGGGTGGHFFPMLAVARALLTAADEVRQIDLRIIYMSASPYDAGALADVGIRFSKVRSGKVRRYFSLKNITDPFRTLFGIMGAIWKFFIDPPDVVFSTGGHEAFPVLVAAHLFRIPTLIYDADAIPGRVTRYASKFAERIAINFAEAAAHLPSDRTALTGHPVRRELTGGIATAALSRFALTDTVPVLVVLGGSQGAEALNDLIIAALPRLRSRVHVVHQTGKIHEQLVKDEVSLVDERQPAGTIGTYHAKGFFTEEELRDLGSIARIVIARAGAGTISEIALWGVPSILIPLPESAQDHQRLNAYAFARIGAGEVLEQQNCTPNMLASRVEYILDTPDAADRMRAAARAFSRPDAATTIARELLTMARHQ